MSENIAGLIKILGITILLLLLWGLLAYYVPETFLKTSNIENLLRRTALYGVLGIGVAFVIISSGIDLSIGSLVCLSACLLAMFLHVEYVPVDATDVWKVDSKSNTLMVSAAEQYQIGDQLWYYKDRRNNGLLKIKEIKNESADSRVSILVDGEIKRDQESADDSPVATVVRAFPVVTHKETRIQLSPDFPDLEHNDKIRFVHPDSASREKSVSSRESDGTIELKDAAPGIDATFFAVPIRRSPLMPIPLAILSVLGITLALGLIHGLLITKLKLQPFVVTLCGLLIYRGLSRWLTNDQTVGFIEYRETLGEIATGRWVIWESPDGVESFGIPYSFFIFMLFTILAIVFLNLTVLGRYLLAIGRNEEAARYSGINSARITILAYILCAVLTGIGGMMFAIDSNSIAPSSFGNFFELYAIAAAVLGGCSLRGGEGSILGVVVGTALMQTLYNSIVLLKIPDELEFTIIGAVILIGVSADEIMRRFASRFRGRES